MDEHDRDLSPSVIEFLTSAGLLPDRIYVRRPADLIDEVAYTLPNGMDVRANWHPETSMFSLVGMDPGAPDYYVHLDGDGTIGRYEREGSLDRPDPRPSGWTVADLRPAGKRLGDRMAIEYAHERFYAAMRIATSRSEFAERLGGVFITISVLDADDLPLDLRNDFTALMTAVAGGGSWHRVEGTILATLAALPKEHARNAMDQFLLLYDRLARSPDLLAAHRGD